VFCLVLCFELSIPNSNVKKAIDSRVDRGRSLSITRASKEEEPVYCKTDDEANFEEQILVCASQALAGALTQVGTQNAEQAASYLKNDEKQQRDSEDTEARATGEERRQVGRQESNEKSAIFKSLKLHYLNELRTAERAHLISALTLDENIHTSSQCEIHVGAREHPRFLAM